jgi:signal transduction histidine kinase
MAALGSLVAGIAHEINTPVGVGVTAASYLNQVTGQFKEFCKQGKPLRHDMIEYLENLQEASDIIQRNLERAGKLIQSFKQVAVDQSSESMRVFNIKKYLDEILMSMKPTIKKYKHRITVDCEEHLSINGYPGAFAQVITNLVMNTLVHAYEPDVKGNIRISVRQTAGVIELVYANDGKSMDSSVIAKIFDPFFTTKRGTGGTGLGLYIVYNIITQQFGGTIECVSDSTRGVKFHICLPAEEGEAC